VDANGGVEQVTLIVANGTLSLGNTAGLTTLVGNGGSNVVFTGTLTNLNAALNGLTYTPNTNYFGVETLSIATDDLGNTGNGGPQTSSSSVDIDVAYNPPVVTASGVSTAYTEKAAPTVVDPGLTLNPGTLPSLTGATVQISGNYASGEDVLNVANGPGMGNIAWSWNAGVLTLTSAGNSATLANWQTALRNVTYKDTSADPSVATRTVTFTVTDGLSTQSAAQQLTVIPVNDPPTLAAPASYAATERITLSLTGTGITVADVDGNAGVETLTLSVVSGVINASVGTTGVAVTNSGSASVTLDGTIAQLKSLLAGSGGAVLSYINASHNPPASDALTLTINDGGYTGGGSLSASRTSTITIAAVNDPPVNSVPGAQTTSYNTSLVFSAGGGNRISVSDVDGNSGVEQLTLSVSNGKLSLAATTGLTLVSGANGSATMTYRGTLANLNAALDGMTYTPANNYSGADTLSIISNDLGNTGSGGQLTTSSAVSITTALPPPVIPPPPPVTTPPAPPPSPPASPPPASPPPTGSPGPGSGTPGGSVPPGGSGGVPAPVEPVGSEIVIDVGAANDRNAQGVLLIDGRMRGADFIKVSAGPGWAMPVTASSPGLASLAIGAGLEKEATLPAMGTETLTISSTDPEFARAPDAVKLAAYKSTLGNKAWVSELDRIRDSATGQPSVEHKIVGSTVAVTGAMSVGYVIWLLRGGLLLSSLLSSLPAWHAIDPMPVLARAGNSEDDGEEDDPLETLFGRAKAAIGLGRSRAEADAPQPPSAPAPAKSPRPQDAAVAA
jgi:hypothetical protein